MKNFLCIIRTLLCCILIFIINLSLFAEKESKKKLLIYASINDSILIFRNDTTWLKDPLCIQLNIDTIDLTSIKFSRKKNFRNGFFYNGNFFHNEQLFDLEEYTNILDGKLYSFTITGVFIESYLSDIYDPCINKLQKSLIKQSWAHYHNQNKKCKIYFESINIILFNEKKIELNSIICEIG